jgi:hypothetical protein
LCEWVYLFQNFGILAQKNSGNPGLYSVGIYT